MREDYIPLELIQLDQENLRTGDTDTQRDAIQAVIRQQALKNFNKLERIGAHIVEHGLSPIEPLLLVPDDENDGFFIVKEGNRRITALKLLERPDLSDDEGVRRKFETLSTKYTPANEGKIKSAIFDTEEEAMVWIELRHSTKLEGAGQEKWDSVAHENADVRKGKFRRGRAVLEFLKAHRVDTRAYEENRQKHRKTTAIDRILGDGCMRSVLGVYIKTDGTITFENGDFQAGIRLLKRLMDEMTLTDFNTDRVYSKNDREYFIEQFDDMAVKSAPTSAPAPSPAPAAGTGASATGETFSGDASPSGGGQGSGPAGPGGNPTTPTAPTGGFGGAGTTPESRGKGTNRPLDKDPAARKTLAQTGNGEKYHIHDVRLRNLYNNLKNLNVDELSSVAACMIRVFLDLSVTHFLLECAIPHPKPGKKWDDWDTQLRQKCEFAVRDLDPHSSLKELDIVRKSFGDGGYMHSIESLNRYIHELAADPVALEVKKIWDRYHPLFKLMYKKLDSK